MNRLDELLLHWQDQSISAAELAELKQLLARPEGRAQAAREFFLTGVILEAVRAQSVAAAPAIPARRRLTGVRLTWLVGLTASVLVVLGAILWLRKAELPPTAPRGHFAQLEQVQGETFVVSAQRRSPAQAGQLLVAGQGIRTEGMASEAVVKLEDAVRLTLRGDTAVSQADADRVVLEHGDLLVEFSERVGKMTVETPIGVAVSESANTAMEVHDAAGLVVMRGEVNFIHKATGKSIRINQGNYLAATQEGDLYSAQLFSGEANVWTRFSYVGNEAPCLAFSPDGRWLAATARSADDGVRLGPLDGSEPPVRLKGSRCLRFSSDGRLLAAGDSANVLLYDVATTRQVQVLAGKDRMMRAACLAFAPDGQLLAVGRNGWGGNAAAAVELWDVAAGKQRSVWQSHAGGVNALAFSPDGRLVASGGYDQTVVVWDVAANQERTRILTVPGFVVWGLDFSPDSKTLAIAGGPGDYRFREPGEVRLWEAATESVRLSLQGHTRAVTSIRYSANGRTLVTASADTTVRFWDPRTGRQYGMLKGHKAATGFESIAAVLSPDGNWLATASQDRTVKVWRTTWLQQQAGNPAAHLLPFRGFLASHPAGSW